MTLKTQAEFFQAHAVDNQLTPEQMVEMLSLPEGDTMLMIGAPDSASSASPDAASDPAAAPASDPPAATPAPTPEPTPAPTPAPTPVVVAKDGVHTIPYSRLEEATQRANEAAAEAERLRKELEAVRAAPAPTPAPTAAPAPSVEPGAGLFGDYSEEAMQKGIQTLVQQATAPLQAEIDRLKGREGEAQAQAQKSAAEQHWTTLYTAHPDLDSVVESNELKAWIGGKSRLEQQVINLAIQQGTTEEVVEVFDRYKQETGKAQPKPSTAPASPSADAAALAAKAVAQAKSKPPTSLSEIPAGTSAHVDEAQAALEMTAQQALRSFEGKSPEQINRLLSRVL